MAKPASALAPTLTSPRSASALARDMADAVRRQTRGGRWGVIAVSLTRGDTLFATDADVLLKPASTLKLLTSSLALETFGADYTFTTEVLSDRIDSGVVAGNLYLRGGGDPTLSLKFSPGESPTDELARQIHAAGIRRVRGDVVADESAFAPERIPVGWKRSYRASAYAAPVSALSLNENTVWIVARPSANGAVVELDPPSTALPVTPSVRLVEGRGAHIVVGQSRQGIFVRGWIGTASPVRRYKYVVQDPPVYAAGALASSLVKVGVVVDGGLRSGTAPASATRAAAVQSLPLDSIVGYMNRQSINHYAELLYRSSALAAGQPASAGGALETLRSFLAAKAGTRRDAIRIQDGSGLSEADTVTARSLVQALAYSNLAPWGSAYHQSLPIAGQSEHLKRRMRGTLAHGNLHAKTGTTNTVASLAGYVTALNGELLAFAFIYNGRELRNARGSMDRMGSQLASFYRE